MRSTPTSDAQRATRRPHCPDEATAITVAGCVLVLALLLAVPAHGRDDGFTVVEPRRAVPELRLRGIDGAIHDISAMRGNVVLVNFWATWCLPCVEELPSLERLRDELHRAGLKVLAVNAGETADPINAFLARFRPRLKFPVLLDEGGDAFDAWKVFGLPTTYVIDKRGRLAYYATGARAMDSEVIRAQLAVLLEESEVVASSNLRDELDLD